MNRLVVTLLLIFMLVFPMKAGEAYCFRIYLNEKGASGPQLEMPENFLSPEALERRLKRGKEISFSDLPIANTYLDTLTNLGGTVVTQSKWFSTVVIASMDSLIVERMQGLSFVDSVKWVWKGKFEENINKEVFTENAEKLNPSDEPVSSHYGYAQEQIEILKGSKLHKKGFTGDGICIAVIDAGFTNVDHISFFDSLRLAGTRNFVFPGESVFKDDDHGTKVLSCLAANTSGLMVGTAPDATYWLLKSEDSRTEFPIEEDYWVAAAEFADSVGVDIISSSLGYFTFDTEEMSYSPDLLDGKTAFISRAAAMAAEKGILVISSAGNEGGNIWEKITFPSDAADILTVGAIDSKKEKSNFSSTGFTADYRVKPDVVALGTGCCVIDKRGNIRYANGTSFAAPIVAGLTACLWQAYPSLTSNELITLLQKTASQHKRPDAEKGYGIPNFQKALKKGKQHGR